MMKSCSRLFLGILNVIILAFATFQAVFVVMSNRDSSNNHCYKDSGLAIFSLSLWLCVLSVLGLIGTCCNSRSLQSIFVWLMLMSTTAAIAFTLFMFLALPKESANATYQRTQDGMWLKAFTPVMRSSLVNGKDWKGTEQCLEKMQFCNWFESHPPTLRMEYLRFLQKGCCMPPARCGFQQMNGSYWEVPKSGLNLGGGMNEECQMWAKGGDNSVCYDCDSCKAGYLAKFQMDWHADKGVFVVILVILILNTLLAYWTFEFRNESDHEKEKQRKRFREMVNA